MVFPHMAPMLSLFSAASPLAISLLLPPILASQTLYSLFQIPPHNPRCVCVVVVGGGCLTINRKLRDLGRDT